MMSEEHEIWFLECKDLHNTGARSLVMKAVKYIRV